MAYVILRLVDKYIALCTLPYWIIPRHTTPSESDPPRIQIGFQFGRESRHAIQNPGDAC
jgi:hypothetical protein